MPRRSAVVEAARCICTDGTSDASASRLRGLAGDNPDESLAEENARSEEKIERIYLFPNDDEIRFVELDESMIESRGKQ
ncbi:MAG: hypothetical protein KA419_07380 [Acidobacteria bacterium]|nr:hypothetical protein [Acidobacteriota bacterium]